MSTSEIPGDINPGHYFELMDRVHVASNYLQMALGGHPVLATQSELKQLYESAVAQLDRLYQAVGQRENTWE